MMLKNFIEERELHIFLASKMYVNLNSSRKRAALLVHPRALLE